MRKTKWFTMAAAVTLSATLAVAAPHGGGEGKGKGRHGKHGRGGQEFSQRFAQKLNLTDAQQQQIRVLQEGFKERNKAFFESSKATRQQFREAKKANDTARLDSLKPAMDAQRQQFKQMHDQQMQQVLAVLTAEQRAQFEALKAQRGERGNRGGRNKLH